MIATEKLESLQTGDVIELPPLFPGLSPEPVLLTMLGKLAGVWQFKMLYHGVNAGRVFAKVKNGQVEFEQDGQ
jgi:hypothetical protein